MDPEHGRPDIDRTGSSAEPGEAPRGELGRLVQVERRLDEMLEKHRAEAADIVEQARRDAERVRAGLEQIVQEEARVLEERVGRETDRRITEIRERAAERIRRYRSLTDDEIGDLASLVVDGVLAVHDDGEGP